MLIRTEISNLFVSLLHLKQFARLMINGYKVITLCGSTRFKDEFLEAQKRLTLEGNVVISVGLFGHSGDEEVWTEGVKDMLDRQHLAKINLADEIFVINVGGYIGCRRAAHGSTSRAWS